jgi:hypothetical protein
VPPVGAARGLPLAIEVDAEREESDAEREISNPLGHFSGERFRGKRAIPGSIQGVLSAPGGWLNGEITRKGDFFHIEPKYDASGRRPGEGIASACRSLEEEGRQIASGTSSRHRVQGAK